MGEVHPAEDQTVRIMTTITPNVLQDSQLGQYCTLDAVNTRFGYRTCTRSPIPQSNDSTRLLEVYLCGKSPLDTQTANTACSPQPGTRESVGSVVT